MGRPSNRDEALARLRQAQRSGKIIVGAGAGIGLSAKSIASGDADLIILYNSGRYRMAGRGSLAGLMPYGNANDVVVSMASEILPLVTDTTILAGVCASDPFCDIPRFLRRLKDMGFAGVQNFPTVGLIDGMFRQNLEETGMGYEREVEMVREASKAGLLTTPYVFNRDEARRMAEAGADVLVAHMGLTASAGIGAKTGKTLDESAQLIKEIEEEARRVNKDIIVLCHGGPIAMPEDARYIIQRCRGIQGFYGASSMERLPAEKAIENVTKEFKAIVLN